MKILAYIGVRRKPIVSFTLLPVAWALQNSVDIIHMRLIILIDVKHAVSKSDILQYIIIIHVARDCLDTYYCASILKTRTL